MNQIIPVIIKTLQKWAEDYEHPTLRRSSRERNPYKTLIACLLSLRTQDKNTDKTSRELFKVADTPEGILKIPQKKLEKIIYSSGYYKNKAKTIKHVSKVILEKYNGKVPSELDELMSIKGVGRKTANIVLVYGHNKEGLPIDVHCSRIPNRLGWIKTKNANETEQVLRKILPKQYWNKFNDLFVKFGQNICVPVSPYCSKCPINKYCKKVDVKTSR